MKKHLFLVCLVAGVVIAALLRASAQTPAGTSGRVSAFTAEQVLPMTCAQAWVVSGKSYAPMLEILKTLARVSLSNRELTFPNTREAGIDVGRGVAADCKADPHALLYAIVDRNVRRVAETR